MTFDPLKLSFMFNLNLLQVIQRIIALPLMYKYLKQVDIIKIDVEDSELGVLRGLKNRLSKRLVNFIVLEVHSSSLLMGV